MKPKDLRKLVEPFRIEDGRKFRLKDIDPDEDGPKGLEAEAETLLADGIARLSELQARLYAQNEWSVLLIFQAMDAAGKDGTIKHVMTGIDPAGVEVVSFKQPSAEELDHDFLWRCLKRLPERGRIGIFNRSYYEETLVVRVHPEFLEAQHLPKEVAGKKIWQHRFDDINAVERYLARNGVVILKFFLHVSKEEQQKRFLERLDRPEKNWKFSAADLKERERWNEYMDCYEEMVRETASPHAPWIVVPADHKWFTRLVVANTIIDALQRIDLQFPVVDKAKLAELKKIRTALSKSGKS
jgi:PPK2 family polyphosphate:nucleotide phosphotransferase